MVLEVRHGEAIAFQKAQDALRRRFIHPSSNIYLQYKVGVKSYEEAESEASCARSAFIKAELNEQMFNSSAELWKRIEAPAERFMHERTLEAAEAFYRAVYNV